MIGKLTNNFCLSILPYIVKKITKISNEKSIEIYIDNLSYAGFLVKDVFIYLAFCKNDSIEKS